MRKVINSFKFEYSFLSNFYNRGFINPLTGVVWPTVEHFFQAYKTNDEQQREKIRNAKTPAAAKRMGRSVRLRAGWHRYRLIAMRRALRYKFTQNADLREKLLATGDAFLVEGNDWNDTFWGVSNKTGKGRNMLGYMLMELREKLAKERQ